MALRGKPAVIFDRRSTGSRAYFNLADEIVHRYRLSEDSMGLKQGSSIPDPIDPLSPVPDGEADESESNPALKMPSAGGLDKFLADLGGPQMVVSSIPSFEEPAEPEMVSLDDLLAEEEDRGDLEKKDENWDEGFWNHDSKGEDRFN